MTLELRKMAEAHALALYQQAFDATIKDRPTYRMVDCYVEFARLVAEDCAKILNEVDNSTDESLSPNKVLCFAGAAIMKKYDP
jgi:hypothetical protein